MGTAASLVMLKVDKRDQHFFDLQQQYIKNQIKSFQEQAIKKKCQACRTAAAEGEILVGRLRTSHQVIKSRFDQVIIRQTISVVLLFINSEVILRFANLSPL